DSLGQVTSFGGTGVAGELITATGGGIAVGSLSGSLTQKGAFQIDYVRIDNAQALGSTGSPMSGPAEPTVCTESVTPSAIQTPTAYELGAANGPIASIDIGATQVADGMSRSGCGDGNSVVATIGGRDCR